jgi:acyl-CoA reductase-like NAD-dependent aldehyde dehydrogenase
MQMALEEAEATFTLVLCKMNNMSNIIYPFGERTIFNNDSRDVSRALGVARRIESGICHINGPTVQDEAPVSFGGVKSGAIRDDLRCSRSTMVRTFIHEALP